VSISGDGERGGDGGEGRGGGAWSLAHPDGAILCVPLPLFLPFALWVLGSGGGGSTVPMNKWPAGLVWVLQGTFASSSSASAAP
jgi:hypothetical protein